MKHEASAGGHGHRTAILKVPGYGGGRMYMKPIGRYAPQEQVIDPVEIHVAPVIDIVRVKPDWRSLWAVIERELKIRYYRPRSIKNYRVALRHFARWCKRFPHEVTRENVKDYLRERADRGVSHAWTALTISVLRTCLDKFGGMNVTEGILTPRRGRRLPNVLGAREVGALIGAAPSLRDKLLLGLMYACGLRVSEVCRLRWRDVSVERRMLSVKQAKGNKDRTVMLPVCFLSLLERGKTVCDPNGFLFSGGRDGKHLTTRMAQLVLKRTARLAGLKTPASCHTLRHSFATHMVEQGTDVRFIQELLGHSRLETTRIYTHVSQIDRTSIRSPLDRLAGARGLMGESGKAKPEVVIEPPVEAGRGFLPGQLRQLRGVARPREASDPVGTRSARPEIGRPILGIGIKLRDFKREGRAGRCNAEVDVKACRAVAHLVGIRVTEPRKEWIALEIPPLEAWEEELAKLDPEERRRVESVEFYEMLKVRITERFLALREAQGGGGA